MEREEKIVALRCFNARAVKSEGEEERKNNEIIPRRILIFDTETTTDIEQKLKVGYFEVYSDGNFEYSGLFYGTVSDKELMTLKKYANEHSLDVYTSEEFLDEVLIEELRRETCIVGFNLAFDLSRVARKWKTSKDGESIYLQFNDTEHHKQFGVSIRHIDKNLHFFKQRIISNFKKQSFEARYLELKTLSHVLSDEKNLTLKTAGEIFKARVVKREFDFATHSLRNIRSLISICPYGALIPPHQ